MQDDSVDLQDQSEASEPWIGVVPVQIGESEVSNGNQESFAAAVVNKVSLKMDELNPFPGLKECGPAELCPTD